MKTQARPSTPKENKRNYYRVLFVQPDAPMEIIAASFRTIMQKLKAHPDLGGDTWNAAIINEAYQTLIDAQRRASYDKTLFAEKQLGELGLQSESQRNTATESATASDLSATWQEFQPRKI